MTSCEYVSRHYNVPACIGRRIRYTSPVSGVREGIILGGTNYIEVNFDEYKPGQTVNIHPTDPNLEYLGTGKIRKMTRGQKRYRAFINAESGLTFAEWLGIKPKPILCSF